MFLVAEEENSGCSHFNPLLLFNPPLLFIFKGHGLKAHGISYYYSDPGHTRSKQQLDKTLKITFASLSRKSDEKVKKKKKKQRTTTKKTKQTRMAIAELFAFYANTMKSFIIFPLHEI